jgi:hypothetical protein
MSIFGDVYSAVSEISKRLGIYNHLNEYKNNLLLNIYKIDLCNNSSLLKSTKNKRCFIISSGASINNYNLKLISKETLITNGTLYKHPDFRSLEVDYHYIGAPAFAIQKGHRDGFYINQCINNKKDLTRWLKRFSKKNRRLIHTTLCKKPSEYFFELDSILSPDTTIIANILSKKYIQKSELYLNNNIYYFLRSQLAGRNIEIDYTKLLRLPDGGIHGCISLAQFLGFKDIYILGNDYTFNPSLLMHDYDSPKFSKKLGRDKAFKYMNLWADSFRADILSISEDNEYYIPVFSRDNDTFDEEHWNMHKIMNQFAKDNNQTIYNVVPEGIDSSVYKKISWSEVVKLTKQTESTSG